MMRRQSAAVLGIALLLFVGVGAAAQLSDPNARFDDHESRISALEEAVFGTSTTTTTTKAPAQSGPAETPTTTVTTVAPTVPAPEPGHDDSGSPPANEGAPPVEAEPAPGEPVHLVIDQDTTITATLTLRPGDTIEFRNGARLMFGPGGSADWQGTPTTTWADDGRSQNLERDIEIFGDGDIMFMEGSRPSTIKYVEIELHPKQELGHYPLHWHFAGDSVRGTFVQGVVIKASTNRAFVTHASHGITIKDSIAKNTVGEAFWWDLTTREERQAGQHPNASHDIVWDHNLADGVFDTPLTNNVRISAFVLGDGKNNVLRDSVAMNVRSNRNKDCSGFHWPEGIGSVWTFENNVAHHVSCHGIFVWQNSEGSHRVVNFRGYANGMSDIKHGAYRNGYVYENVQVERVILLANGTRFIGGSIGALTSREHRLEGNVEFHDVTVGSFTVDNAPDGINGGNHYPGDYVFVNSNLAPDAISVTSALPGTKVTIDGQVSSLR